MAQTFDPLSGNWLPETATREDCERVVELWRAMRAADRRGLTAREIDAATDRLDTARAASAAAVAQFLPHPTDYRTETDR